MYIELHCTMKKACGVVDLCGTNEQQQCGDIVLKKQCGDVEMA